MAATSLPGGESGLRPPSMGGAAQVAKYDKWAKRNKSRIKSRSKSSGGGSSNAAGKALMQRTLRSSSRRKGSRR